MLTSVTQQEVKWHLAQMLPRLALDSAQRQAAVQILAGWFADASSAIVRVNSLQAVCDLAGNDPKIRPVAKRLIANALAAGSPALKNRAQKLARQIL